jgi:hypothetical protein
MCESWAPLKKQCFFGNRGVLDKKLLSHTLVFARFKMQLVSFTRSLKKGLMPNARCSVTTGDSVLESPELNLARRMMSAVPPFVPSSSKHVTNEQCIKDSQFYLQELRHLAVWALKSEYLLKRSESLCAWQPYCMWSLRPLGIPFTLFHRWAGIAQSV